MRAWLLHLLLMTVFPSPAAIISPDDIGDSSCARRVRAANLQTAKLSMAVWSYFGRTFDEAGFFEMHPDGQNGYWCNHRGDAHVSGGFVATAASRAQKLRNRWPWIHVNPAQSEVSSGSEGPTLLDRNQYFPLDVMERSGYISSALRQSQVGVADTLNPSQLLFIEAISARSAAELVNAFGSLPPTSRRDPMSEAFADYWSHFALSDDERRSREAPPLSQSYQLKEGAIWVVSGQPAGVQARLYLENEALLTPVDREKYRFAWELGRAAQISSHAFSETLQVALYFITRELILLGGKVEDGYIFGASLNKRIGSVYRRFYQMKDFSGYRDSPTQMAHIRTLADTLRTVDITAVNGHVRDLVAASEGKLSNVDALRLWLYAQQARTQYLSNKQGTLHVQLRDFSSLAPTLIGEEARKHPSIADCEACRDIRRRPPITEFRDVMVEYAEHSSYPYVIPSTGVMVKKRDRNTNRDFMELQNLDEFLIERNAIEIFTRDSIDSDRLLAIAYRHAIAKLKEAGDPNAHETLQRLGVQFVVVGKAPGSAKVDGTWYIHRQKIETLVHWGFTSHRETLRPEVSLAANAYTVDSVREVSERLGADVETFDRGSEHLRQYFANPDLTGF